MNRPTRNAIIALVAIGGTLSCCVGSCVLLGVIGAHEQATWEPLATACDGFPASSAPPYARTPGVHRVALFERSGTAWIHQGYGSLPDDLLADAPTDAQLVVCVDPDATTELVEHCEYVMDGTAVRVGGGTLRSIDRHRQVRTLSIREAHTGSVLSQSRLYGPLPDLCPDEYDFNGGMSDRIDGADPGPEEIRPLLEGLANIRFQ